MPVLAGALKLHPKSWSNKKMFEIKLAFDLNCMVGYSKRKASNSLKANQ